MKLKLEETDGVAVLAVLPSGTRVTHAQVQVIKAGLKKLFESGKSPLVIDFTQIPEAEFEDKDLIQVLATLPGWALEHSALLAIASPIAGLGQAATRAEAIQIVKSPSIKLIAQEAQLKAKQTLLTKEKKELEQKLNSVTSGGGDIKALQKEQSDLKRIIQGLEKQLALMLKEDRKPFSSDLTKAQNDTVEKLLSDALEQQGVPLK